MGFINVNLVDKKSWLDTADKHFQVSSRYNTSYAVPSLFNFSNQYYGMNYFVSNPNPWGNFYNPMPVFNFTPFNFSFTPALNFLNFTPSSFSFTPFSNTNSLFSNIKSKSSSKTDFKFTNYSKKSLNEADYNKQKGEKLAAVAKNNATGFNNTCALKVRLALEKCGLGTGERGDGYEYARILSNNKNFKEISTSGLDLSDLPAGCILVYNKGTAGYSSEYGHVEITLGNGKAVSDGITNNIKQGARVFIPV